MEQCFSKCTSHIYAGGTCIDCSVEDIDELCNDRKAEAVNIAEWLQQNKLRINTDKMEFMVVGHRRQTKHILRSIEISIKGESIKRAKKVKYLGITADENLTWDKHYKKLKCKIKAALSPLQKLMNILIPFKLGQTYKALFESHLRYSNELKLNEHKAPTKSTNQSKNLHREL